MRILLVEDEPELARMVTDHLARQSFALDLCGSVDEAESALAANPYDLVILDLSLPDGDGMDVLKRLRNRHDGVPVLAATARDAVDQRIKGLDLGLDDYLVKPYDLGELTARVRALLRRPGQPLGVELRCGNLLLDTRSMAVAVDGRAVVVGRRGVALLESLMRSAGKVVSRRVLEERMYGIDDLVESNALEAIVSRLRRLLTDQGCSAALHTVRGVGYMLSDGG